MQYTSTVHVQQDFDRVVATTIDALEAAGFGILCDIDVRATLREKLGEEFQNYRILGACVPQLAYEAMAEEVELGALLPCNVIVYETDDRVNVSAVSPPALLALVENEELEPIANDVEDRFADVLQTIEDRA